MRYFCQLGHSPGLIQLTSGFQGEKNKMLSCIFLDFVRYFCEFFFMRYFCHYNPHMYTYEYVFQDSEKMKVVSNTPTAPTLEMSDYEKIREGNIAEREEMLSALKADVSDFKRTSGIAAAKKAPPKKKKKVDDVSGVDAGGFQRKSARLSATPEDNDKIGSEVT